MEALVLLIGIAFITGIVVRSLFLARRPSQVIYVQTDPVDHNNGGGCLLLILLGGLVLVLLLAVGGA